MMSAREITSAAVSLETLRHDASYKITIKGTNICGFVSGDFSLEYDTEKVNTSLLSYGDITTPLRDAFLFSKSNASRNMLTIALSTENDIDEAGDVTFITLTLPHEAIRDESAPFVLRKALLNEGKIPTTIIEETVPVQSQFHTKFDSRLQRYMLQRNRFGSVSAKVSLFDLRGKRRRVPFGKQSNSVDASESFSSGIIIVYDRNDDSKALIPLINAK